MAVICQPHLNEAEEGGKQEAVPGDERDAHPVKQFNENANQGVGEREVLQSVEETPSTQHDLQSQGGNEQDDDEHPAVQLELCPHTDEHDKPHDGSQAKRENGDKGVSNGLLMGHQCCNGDCAHTAEQMPHQENAELGGGENRLKGSPSYLSQQCVQEDVCQQRIIRDGNTQTFFHCCITLFH